MNYHALHTLNPDTRLNTLLSPRALVPVTCDCCEKETEVSYETLLTSATVMCEHCYQVQNLSKAELETISQFLSMHGYHITRY